MKKILYTQIYMVEKMWNISKILFFTTILNAIISGIIPTVSVYLSKLFVDQLTAKNFKLTIIYIFIIIGINVFQFLFGLLISKINQNSYAKIKRTMDCELFEKVACLDMKLFDITENKTLYAEAKGAVQNNRCSKILDSFFSILSSIITLSTLTIVLSSVQPIVFVVIIAVIILQTVNTIWQRREQYSNWKMDAKTNREIVYCMGLIADRGCACEMKMEALSSWIINKYKSAINKSDKLWKKNNKDGYKHAIISNILNNIEELFLYLFLAVQMVFFNMSYANFTMFFSSIRSFSQNISAIVSTVIDIGENVIYIKSFKEFIALKNNIAVEHENDIHLDNYQPESIKISDLSFKYPESEQYVLHNVNLTLKCNRMYVIVGVNGAGKTTFINLLCRIYDPSSGSIFLDQTDIRRYNYKEYRNMFGVVFQDYKTYGYSIAENIALNRYDNSEECRKKVDSAIEMVGMTDKINHLPKGIDTTIGKEFDEEGIYLSGGEIQKIALAKALFKDSKILILDEPTSALDAFAEDDLIRTFQSATRGKTVFYISHRLSVAKYADKVIFIDGNTVSGFDTHEQLIKNNRRYAEMYEAQAKHYT